MFPDTSINLPKITGEVIRLLDVFGSEKIKIKGWNMLKQAELTELYFHYSNFLRQLNCCFLLLPIWKAIGGSFRFLVCT